jgi:peptidyl-tRNA hydrolase
VRADVPHGVQAAQLIHAAGESSTGNLPRGTYAIALAANDEKHLWNISQLLITEGIMHKLILEPDAPWNGALMAIGIVPGPRKRLKKILSTLKTLR